MDCVDSFSLDSVWQKFEDYWKDIIQEVKMDGENDK